MDVQLDLSDLTRLAEQLAAAPEAIKETIRTEMRSAQTALVQALVREAPSRTGKLRLGIVPFFEEGGGDVSAGAMILGSQVPYLWYVIDGTRPHEIRPVSAAALHFTVGGHAVFAKVVHHPGTRPNDFPDRAIADLGWDARVDKMADAVVYTITSGGRP